MGINLLKRNPWPILSLLILAFFGNLLISLYANYKSDFFSPTTSFNITYLLNFIVIFLIEWLDLRKPILTFWREVPNYLHQAIITILLIDLFIYYYPFPLIKNYEKNK